MISKVNNLPVLTWNKLKINNADFDTSFVDGNVDAAPIPICDWPVGFALGVMKQDELPEYFEDLDISNPSEKYVAGKFPIYNEQKFATGMGAEIDKLFAKADATYTVCEIRENYNDETPVVWKYEPGDSHLLAGSVIRVKAGSRAVIVMYVRKDDDDDGKKPDGSFVGFSTRIIVEDGASLKLIKVQRLPESYTFFDDIGTVVGKNANLEIVKLDLGAGKVYEGLNTLQKGDESTFRADFGYVGLRDSFLDLNYNDVFVGKKCEGVMRFSEALFGNAYKALRDTIDFRQDSTGSSGDEQEDVLMFGADVVNKSIPLILCEEEDVEGRHAATLGKLSDEMLFYMQTRGLDRKTAEKIIAAASINNLNNKVPVESIREDVRGYIERTLAE